MRLVVLKGPAPAGPFLLGGTPVVLGRDPGLPTCLPSRRVSRRHAEARLAGDALVVRDLGSHNGLLDAAGVRRAEVRLRPGEVVQVGDYVLRFDDGLGPSVGEEPSAPDLALDLDELDDDVDLAEEDEYTPAAGISAVHRNLPRPEWSDGNGEAPTTPTPPADETSDAVPLVGATAVAPPFPSALPATTPAPAPAPSAAPTSLPSLPFGPPSGGFGGFAPAPARGVDEIAPPPMKRASPAEVTDAPPALPAAVGPPPFAPAPAAAPPPFPSAGPTPPGMATVARPAPLPPARAPEVAPARASAGRAGPGLAAVPVPAQGALIVVAALGLVFLSPIGGVLAHLWAADTAIREAALDEGARLAEVLAAKNAQALAESRPSAFDLGTVSEQRGVHGAVVADARGTVVAPAERLRHSIQSREAFSEAVKSHDVAAVAREDGLYDIVAPIRAEIAPGSGVKQVVGFSLVEYDAAGRGRERFSPWLRAMASTLVATVAAATLAVGAWWALARPLVQLRDETELALRGDLARVEPPARWGVLADLVHSINRVLARVGK